MDSMWSKLTFHKSVSIFKTDYTCFINHAIKHSILNLGLFVCGSTGKFHGLNVFESYIPVYSRFSLFQI